MSEMVKCPSCGAEFDAKLVRCPYCGTAYEPAAEEEYMGKLDDVHKELKSHRNDASGSAGKALTKTILIFVIAAAVLLIIGICFFVLPSMRHKNRQDKEREEYLHSISVGAQDDDESKDEEE